MSQRRRSAVSILPCRGAAGEGDRPTDGGGSRGPQIRDDPSPGDHPRQARRRSVERGRDRRLHRRPDQRRGDRRPGRRLRHGGLLSRHDARRARGADPRHDALGREPRLARGQPAGPDPRQALDRRRRRQRLADAGADARRLRRLRADDLGPRPRPHRRHARQAQFDPRLRLAARPRAVQARGQGGRLRDHRPDGGPRARRPAPLRHPRRHGDGRIGRAHHRLDPVEEARRRRCKAWSWT